MLWVNVHEICGRGRASDKEHSIRFWGLIRIRSESGINFSTFLSLRDRAIKCELKEFLMNVYDIFGGIGLRITYLSDLCAHFSRQRVELYSQ